RLDLRQREERRGARDLRARPRRRGVRPGLDAELQQPVPGGVELDLVDALAEAVVRAQLRRVLVREPSPLERLPTELGAEREQRLLRPDGTLAPNRVEQRRVRRDDVVLLERRSLVPG